MTSVISLYLEPLHPHLQETPHKLELNLTRCITKTHPCSNAFVGEYTFQCFRKMCFYGTQKSNYLLKITIFHINLSINIWHGQNITYVQLFFQISIYWIFLKLAQWIWNSCQYICFYLNKAAPPSKTSEHFNIFFLRRPNTSTSSCGLAAEIL